MSTMVIKPFSSVHSSSYEHHAFHLDIYSIPNVSLYIYIDISFSDNISLQLVISNMYLEVKKYSKKKKKKKKKKLIYFRYIKLNH